MEKRYDIFALVELFVDLILSRRDIVPRFGQLEKPFGDFSFKMGKIADHPYRKAWQITIADQEVIQGSTL
jgi:hypothetical protein